MGGYHTMISLQKCDGHGTCLLRILYTQYIHISPFVRKKIQSQHNNLWMFHSCLRSARCIFKAIPISILIYSITFLLGRTHQVTNKKNIKQISWKLAFLENIRKYHFFRQLWLFLGVKLMEININLFSRFSYFLGFEFHSCFTFIT